ncbi:Zinc finger protein 358 [Amphibalanus amphitrite]|uniref:Zinc finger protein 358 n=1 Tax=Amphibalanus amphitrite TaxID=1232801 RepID=A0A6A4W792_AMPAM|nr:Zinc finger protein 358 [Amphibalanus amphitrite]
MSPSPIHSGGGLLSPGAAGTSGAVSPPALLARRGDGSRRLRRLLQASHACQDCGRVFRLRPGLAAHRRLAHGDGACEQCAVCQRRFTSGRRLQRHLAAAHGLTGTDHAPSTDDKIKESSAHECPTCKKTFTTAQFLKKHMKLHTGETPYVCEVCGRAFSLQQSYHKHQQYHTAVRPYTCPQCGRAFRESATLQNHMRIHSGEKPWTCETCGKSFRQRITYVVHRRIHTGALPYTCELCHSGFRYKLPGAVSGQLPAVVSAQLPDTVGAQLPYRPKVSRVLLRRLVHKLRARQERSSGRPPAAGPDRPEARQSGAGLGALPALSRGPVLSEMQLEPAAEMQIGPVSELGLGSAPDLDLGSAPDLDLGSAPDLDLGQLFEFPVPERRPSPLSPLHRAIESVARELANIPLHSPPPAAAGSPDPESPARTGTPRGGAPAAAERRAGTLAVTDTGTRGAGLTWTCCSVQLFEP